MDYKQKYKKALERASKLRFQNPFDTVSQMVEYIFPELKESEDENKASEKNMKAYIELKKRQGISWEGMSEEIMEIFKIRDTL